MPAHTTRLTPLLLAALVLGAAFAPGIHAGETEHAATGDPQRLPWHYHEIVDPDRSPEARAPALQLLVREADEGGRTAAALLGRLHMMGESHPAAPVSRDLGQAEHYLQVALGAGDIAAMLWLAEIELLNRRPLEAAIWVQSYLHLRAEPEELSDGTGYVPALLERIAKAPGGTGIQRDLLAEYVLGFISSHGERLRAAAAGEDHRGTGMAKSPALSEREECRVLERVAVNRRAPSTRERYRQSRETLRSTGHAVFLAEIPPDGEDTRIMLVHSVPDAEYGLWTRPVATSMKFNEVPADCRSRWALLPVELTNSEAQLMR